MKEKQKLSNLKSFIPSAGLLCLLLIVAVTVSSLNPIVEQSSSNLSSGQVAGVNTISDRAPIEASLINTNFPSFQANAEVLPKESEGTYLNAKLSFNSIQVGEYSEPFIKIYNPNSREIKTKMKFFIPQEIKGKIKVYLKDSKDLLTMYSIERSYSPKTITLQPFETREFKVNLEVLEAVENNFDLLFLLTDGV